MAIQFVKDHKTKIVVAATAVVTAIIYALAGDSITDILTALQAAF